MRLYYQIFHSKGDSKMKSLKINTNLKFLLVLKFVFFLGIISSQEIYAESINKILVLGGNGQLGSEIVKDLVAEGKHTTVMVRATSNLSRIENLDVKYVIGDILVEEDVKRIFAQSKYHTVIDALAAGRNIEDSFYSESQKLISKYASENGVKHMILHGAIGAGESRNLFNKTALEGTTGAGRGLTSIFSSKDRAEKTLISSGVTYTIMRHLTLLPLEIKESGNAEITEDQKIIGAISRDGLARLTMECLDNPRCFNKIFHAVDKDVELTGRYENMWTRFTKTFKPEILDYNRQ